MAYFDSSVFQGFGDDNEGFYAVYRNLFDELARQEEMHADFSVDSNREPIRSTTFGSSHADQSTVKEFYNFWTSFVTKMSFAWVDDYETQRVQVDT